MCVSACMRGCVCMISDKTNDGEGSDLRLCIGLTKYQT